MTFKVIAAIYFQAARLWFGGLPGGLAYVNVRHAHSHLMFFGWVTPALMGLIAATSFDSAIALAPYAVARIECDP